jgi:hypothetical protein
MKLAFCRSSFIEITITCGVFALICGLSTPGMGAETDSKSAVIKTVIAGLKARESLATTATGYFVKEWYNNTDPKMLNAVEDEHLRFALSQPPRMAEIYWIADRKRVRNDEKILLPENANSYTLTAFNGEKIQRWDFGSPVALEMEENDPGDVQSSEVPYWIQLGLGKGVRPLSENLESRNVRYLGTETISGIETYILEADPAEGSRSAETWWIAPKLASVVVKYQRKSAQPNPNNSIVSTRSVRTVDRLIKVGDDLWIPAASRLVSFTTLKGQNTGEVWQSIHRFSVISLDVNQPVTPRTFELPLPIRTQVIASQTSPTLKGYIVGGDITALEAENRKGVLPNELTLEAPASKDLAASESGATVGTSTSTSNSKG